MAAAAEVASEVASVVVVEVLADVVAVAVSVIGVGSEVVWEVVAEVAFEEALVGHHVEVSPLATRDMADEVEALEALEDLVEAEAIGMSFHSFLHSYPPILSTYPRIG